MTSAWALLLVLQGFLPAATIPVTATAVNRFAGALRTGLAADLVDSIVLAGAAGGLMLAAEVVGFLLEWLQTLQGEAIQDNITARIHEKSAAVDIAFYDSPAFYDHLHRARTEATYRPAALLQAVGGLLSNGIAFVSVLVLMFRFGPVVPLVLLASAVPAFYFSFRFSLRQQEFLRRTAADERRTWYYDWLLTSAQAAAELRLYRLARHFQSHHSRLRQYLRKERARLAGTSALQQTLSGVITLLLTASTALWMLARVARGTGTIGDVVFFGQAIQQAVRMSRALVHDLGQFYANSMFLGEFFEFMSLQPTIRSGSVTPPPSAARQSSVVFDNVTFRYPGATAPTLRGLTLRIEPGQICAIVGPNGAGKSTLAKLLCRLYEPEAGSIAVDGVELGDWPLEELRRSIGALLQEPMRYNTTAAENIAFGNIESPAADVEQAAHLAGADTIIRTLPAGYGTHLGKSFFDGAELSTGQWQRVALARALHSPASLLILDEPTSAMDPWAEDSWLASLRHHISGRTAVIITHRRGTAALADIVHLMEDGRITDSGTHQELLARDARYANWQRPHA